MTRTTQDLRELFDDMSAGAPDSYRRTAQLERRMRRDTRRRVSTAVLAGAAALAVTGILVTELNRPELLPATAVSEELPSSLWGMARIAAADYSVTGKTMTLDFTPTGPDTMIVVRCEPGFALMDRVATTGDVQSPCSSLPPQLGGGSLSLAPNGFLKEGRPERLRLMVVSEDTVDEAKAAMGGQFPPGYPAPPSPKETTTLDEYLAAPHSEGSSPWSVAIYSGTCTEPVPCSGARRRRP
jgi:hypothetical protein